MGVELNEGIAMRIRRVILAIGVTCLAALGDCTTGQDVPAQMESGFDFRTDAFTFQNFGQNSQGVDLSADTVAILCGVDVSCENKELPCVATDLAADWRERVNKALLEGRSEGEATSDLAPDGIAAFRRRRHSR